MSVQFSVLLVVSTYSFLLLEPHPLLILHQERMPGLLHVQIPTTHLE